jgi:hypothetical protein
MRALSVRQPFAELILRGLKTVEYRSRATKIVGERFYLYAAGKWPARRAGAAAGGAAGGRTPAGAKAKAWSLDLAMPTPAMPTSAGAGDGPGTVGAAARPPHLSLPWMAELANGLRLFPHGLPTGVIVGTAVIERVDQRDDGMWQWHLAGVERAGRLRKPVGHPQPVWFEPF